MLSDGGFEQDCKRCRADQELRRKWGCDEPLERAAATVTLACMFCGGEDDDCPECAGTNEVPILRCPNALVRQVHRDAVFAAMRAERGLLPAAGGVHDQAATFVEALPLLEREVAHWRHVAAERERAKAQRRKG